MKFGNTINAASIADSTLGKQRASIQPGYATLKM